MSDIKKQDIKFFLEEDKKPLNTFRTLLLFGRNVATYKFAFCHALLKQKPQSSISYDDLRNDFLEELVNHYQVNKHQFNDGPNNFTKKIDLYIESDRSKEDWNKLLEVSDGYIFNNVLDALQNVGQGTIGSDYKLFEHKKNDRKIILTDNTSSILENSRYINIINDENQSRWNIVEEAWKAGLNPNMLVYDKDQDIFYSVTESGRVGLRSAVDILIPYQKGLCFYCGRKLQKMVNTQDSSFPDVDHFYPLALINRTININPNGVWNLVIACRDCNRGKNGKFDSPPDKIFLPILMKRNLLFVEEHKHSLRNSILLSLNAKNKDQVKKKMLNIAKQLEMIKGWKPSYEENSIH